MNSAVKESLARIGSIYVVLILYHLAENAFLFSNLIILGHWGKGHLASAIVAFVTCNMLILFAEAIQSSLFKKIISWSGKGFLKDTDKKREMASVISIAILLGIIGSFLLCFSYWIFISVGITSHISNKAWQCTIALIPAFLSSLLFKTMVKLNFHDEEISLSQAIIPIKALLIGAFVNIASNYLLIFGFSFGFIGSPISTSISRALSLLLYCFWTLEEQDNILATFYEYSTRHGFAWNGLSFPMKWAGKSTTFTATKSKNPLVNINDGHDDHDDHDDSANDHESESLIELRRRDSPNNYDNNDNNDNNDRHNSSATTNATSGDGHLSTSIPKSKSYELFSSSLFLFVFWSFAKGLPNVLLLLLDFGVLDISYFLVGSLGSVPLCSFGLLIYLTSTLSQSFSSTLGIAFMFPLRDFMKNQDVESCRQLGFLLSLSLLVISVLLSSLMYLITQFGGILLVNDPDIIYRMTSFSMFASSFALLFSIQSGYRLLLRLTFRDKEGFWLLILCYWGIGFPISYYLCFASSYTLDIVGYWIGLLSGQFLLTISFFFLSIFVSWDSETRRLTYYRQSLPEKSNPLADIYCNCTNGMLSMSFVSSQYSFNPLINLFLKKNIEQEMDELENVEMSHSLL